MKRSASRPSDFTQCILIADLTLRLVSKINLKNRLNAKSREGKRRNLRHNGVRPALVLSPPSLSFIFNVFRDIFYVSFWSFVSPSGICVCVFLIFLFSCSSARDVFSLKYSTSLRLPFCANILQTVRNFTNSRHIIVNATLPSNKQYDFHPPCNSRLYGDGAATLLPSCASPFSPSHPFTPTRLPRDHHSRLIIKVWRHRVFSINIPG